MCLDESIRREVRVYAEYLEELSGTASNDLCLRALS